jgi:hypothetical protein
MTLEHVISGELYELLHDGTQLDDGRGDVATWGYCSTREADVEVHAMVHAARVVKRGFGASATMSGSLEAWRGIREYASDMAQVERYGAGDFDRGKGTRLERQVAKLDELLAASVSS